jgi:NADPH:quinone reductase-like Zn-dependent oxidoreductase
MSRVMTESGPPPRIPLSRERVLRAAVGIADEQGLVGVCGPHNVELVRAIGADEVIDYGAEDFTRSGQRFDLMLDIAGSRPIGAGRKVLIANGTLVAVGGPAGRCFAPMTHVLSAVARGPFVSQQMRMADAVASTSKKAHLAKLAALLDAGKVTPVIDRQYDFADIPAALAHQERGHSAGKVVVSLA